MHSRRFPFSAAQLVGVLTSLSAAPATVVRRCSDAPPGRPSPHREEIERALHCDGRSDAEARTACFARIVSALNQWPDDAERRATFAQVERHLNSWSPEHRATRASHVIHMRDRRVLDTMRLARALEDWYPEDSALDTGSNTRLTIASPLADTIDSYKLVRASVSFRWFSEGPGLSRLRSLELRECGDYGRTFALLLRWKALATLERIALSEESEIIQSDSFWTVAREAPKLVELSFVGYGAIHVASSLERERALSQRLRSLSIRSAFVRTPEVQSLRRNLALGGLRVLDLRDNALTDDDVRVLREAPQFKET
ncbi:MAG: hypothetical protein JNK05_12280 [Myxococcales bacterium]|nr:hypothetical protein [Myxococcales bacterium]